VKFSRETLTGNPDFANSSGIRRGEGRLARVQVNLNSASGIRGASLVSPVMVSFSASVLFSLPLLHEVNEKTERQCSGLSGFTGL
jgi:hypothetical protein